MKKRNHFLISIILIIVFIGISSFGLITNNVYAGDGINSPSIPNKGAGPFPPLTLKQKILLNKKLLRYQKWLKMQPKDIDPLDIPLSNLKLNSTLSDIESGEISIPLRRQERYYWCGPASAQEILDYDWGYLSTVSKYSQSFLASKMGTNSTNGTYVYKLTNVLNQYKRSNFLWVYQQISSDETNASNDLYLKTKSDVSDYEGIVYHTNTYPYYGKDVWGERYGLIGYYDPYGYSYHRTYHYVVGYGYLERSNGEHMVKYLDTNSANYGFGNPFGRHTVDARNMATCVIYNARYIIW